jgi:hypothetical protein
LLETSRGGVRKLFRKIQKLFINAIKTIAFETFSGSTPFGFRFKDFKTMREVQKYKIKQWV